VKRVCFIVPLFENAPIGASTVLECSCSISSSLFFYKSSLWFDIGLTGLPYCGQDVEERGGYAEERADKAAGSRDQADAEALPSQGHGLARYGFSFQPLLKYSLSFRPFLQLRQVQLRLTASPGTGFPSSLYKSSAFPSGLSYSFARYSFASQPRQVQVFLPASAKVSPFLSPLLQLRLVQPCLTASPGTGFPSSLYERTAFPSGLSYTFARYSFASQPRHVQVFLPASTRVQPLLPASLTPSPGTASPHSLARYRFSFQPLQKYSLSFRPLLQLRLVQLRLTASPGTGFPSSLYKSTAFPSGLSYSFAWYSFASQPRQVQVFPPASTEGQPFLLASLTASPGTASPHSLARYRFSFQSLQKCSLSFRPILQLRLAQQPRQVQVFLPVSTQV
jgi:hypothetical protein